MTPEPEPGPEPITQVSVTVKLENGGAQAYLGVDYNFNNNPDPYSASITVNQNSSHTFSAYTVPVGGKLGFWVSSNTVYGAEYTVTDAAAEVTVTARRALSGGAYVWTVTDNLSRNVWTFVEEEEK